MRSKTATFQEARDHYGVLGVDVEDALRTLGSIPVSLHCWQGDDVGGFERVSNGESQSNDPGGGLAVTGTYPGKARTPEELRSDLERALSLIPGRHRVNLHAMYGEFDGRRVDRDELEPAHFRNWIDWGREHRLGLDFNPTCFAHPLAAGGFTLAHPDPTIRRFWIEHCRRCRAIGEAMGRALSSPCLTNVWIPDGFKDTPADRRSARERLLHSLDAVFQKKHPRRHLLDAVEGKLFGIGAESCTVGSHEFYLGYAITRQTLLCLDAGHFHPTESVGDKISATLPYLPGLLLHVSRGVRWDSDHVVTLTDELQSIAREFVAQPAQARNRIHLGLDYFDASLNRIAAWVIGTRNLLKAILLALLEPPAVIMAERDADTTARLAWQEEARSLPWAAVWNEYCERQQVPVGAGWLPLVQRYEREVLSQRG